MQVSIPESNNFVSSPIRLLGTPVPNPFSDKGLQDLSLRLKPHFVTKELGTMVQIYWAVVKQCSCITSYSMSTLQTFTLPTFNFLIL